MKAEGTSQRPPPRSVAVQRRATVVEHDAEARRGLRMFSRRGPDAPRSSAAEISDLVGALVVDYFGPEPKARTYLGEDVVTVVVENMLTAGERRLVREGMSELVLGTRAAFQQTMRESLIAGIEAITGRKVRASATETRPDIALETVVLDGSTAGDTAPGAR
jgi:uncharacterized protein YbcI